MMGTLEQDAPPPQRQWTIGEGRLGAWGSAEKVVAVSGILRGSFRRQVSRIVQDVVATIDFSPFTG